MVNNFQWIWMTELNEVAMAWIADMKKNPEDFKGSSIDTIDELIAGEISSNLLLSNSDYEVMSMDPWYDVCFRPYKQVIMRYL